MKQIILLIAMILEITYFASTTYALNSASDGESQIERFALIMGMNDGGDEREKLRYATSDASSFGRTLSELGGVNNQNNTILLEPSKSKIFENLNIIKKKIKDSKKASKRSELFVYYSGHSDEEGLLLGSDKLLYQDLKKNIDAVLADVSVVILDSCASGALTKVKGGKMKAPFLTDDSTNLKGRVFLTSSSSDEVAQESDRIKGSYFTHYLVSGLRGAADTKGDGKITLNEAYHYAYNETLAKTEKMMKGVQHPSYDIQLAGSGELIMTDVKDASARVLLPKTVSGRLFIRDHAENLVVEVNKMPGKSLALGLSEGEYFINLRKDNVFSQAKVILKNDKLAYINESDFQVITGESASTRGGDEKGVKYVNVPFEASIVPKMSTNSNEHELTENNVNLSLVYAETARVNGLMLSFGGTWVNEDVQGGQLSLLFNYAGGDVRGGQLGLANIVNRNLMGAQVGTVNWVKNDLTGASIGYMNIAKNSYGAQIGAINWTQESFSGIGLGHINIFNRSRGVQLGLVNWGNGPLDGVHLGLVNVNRKSVRGAQVGYLNIATEKNQVQVGVVNYTEDPESVPIGLINIVKHGTFNMSVSVDENDFKDFNLKYGSKYSYSYLGFGTNSLFKQFGVGIGGRYPIGDFSMNLELGYITAHSRSKIRNVVGRNVSTSLNQVKLFPKYKVFDHVNLFAGVTYNSFLSHKTLEETPFRYRSGGRSAQKWVGYFGGLEYEL